MEFTTPKEKYDFVNKAICIYLYDICKAEKELRENLNKIDRTDYLEIFSENESMSKMLLEYGSEIEGLEDLMKDLRMIKLLKEFLYDHTEYFTWDYEEYEVFTIALIMFSICLALKELNVSDPLQQVYLDQYVYPSEEMLEILDFAINYYDYGKDKLPLDYPNVKKYTYEIKTL